QIFDGTHRSAMKLHSPSLPFTFLCCLAFVFGCAPQQPATSPDTRAADEAAIRKTDTEWANAAQSKQVDTWVAYDPEDAMVLPPNETMATGKDAIRKTIGNLLS